MFVLHHHLPGGLLISDRYVTAGGYLLRFRPKQSAEILDYVLDFGALALAVFPATLLSVTWSTVPLFGDTTPLAIVSQSVSLNVATLLLTGGTPLVEYVVNGTCVWSSGETSVITFVLPIAAVPATSVPQ